MIEIIPAIDIIDAKCVRLSQGDYNQKKVYNENPVEVAKMFEDAGVRRLHLVDLDGAKQHHIVNYKVLENIATKTVLTIDFGGGLKSDDDLRIAFECGAKMITGGSIAVKNPEVFNAWIAKYGSERIILGADAAQGKIAVTGWTETTELDVVDFIKQYLQKGVNKVISTDIAKDGMLAGPSFELYAKIMNECSGIHLIASGGVSKMDDIRRLDEMNVPGVIVGKALYEGKIQINEIYSYLCKQ